MCADPEVSAARKEKLSSLKKVLEQQEKTLKEKDELIKRYWDTIQSLRLSNRLKSIFYSPAKPLKHIIDFCGTWVRSLILAQETKHFLKNLEKNGLPRLPFYPKVSIVILNRNGKDHLRNLLLGLFANTHYHNYEVIIVDNASDDGSEEYIKSVIDSRIKLIKNPDNPSFSKANNDAVKNTDGEILVFLNNDVIPLYGWLPHLLQVALSKDPVHSAAIGSVLLYPGNPRRSTHLAIQHAGVGFRRETHFIRPINLDAGSKLSEKRYRESEERIAVTGACLLIARQRFIEVGGFDEAYQYGYEDVDLCLKLIQLGYKNYLAGNSFLFHKESATQKDTPLETLEGRRRRNVENFRMKWHSFLERILPTGGIV